jgi:hypothetical protein
VPAARQELARHYGADIVIDQTKGDTVARVLEVAGGGGVAIEDHGHRVVRAESAWLTSIGFIQAISLMWKTRRGRQ